MLESLFLRKIKNQILNQNEKLNILIKMKSIILISFVFISFLFGQDNPIEIAEENPDKKSHVINVKRNGRLYLGKPGPFIESLEIKINDEVIIYNVWKGDATYVLANYENHFGWLSLSLYNEKELPNDFQSIFNANVQKAKRQNLYEKTKTKKRNEFAKKYADRFLVNFDNKTIMIGFTREMVIDILGYPTKENKTTTPGLVSIQMVYYDAKHQYKYVYTTNDIVTAFQE